MPEAIINNEYRSRDQDGLFLQELDNEERSIDSNEEYLDDNDPSEDRRASIDYLEGQQKTRNYDLGVSRPGAFAVNAAPNANKETNNKKGYVPMDGIHAPIDSLEGQEKRGNYDLEVSRPGAFSVKAPAPSVTTKKKLRYAAPAEFQPRIVLDEKGRGESDAKLHNQLDISSQLPSSQSNSEYEKKAYYSQSEGKRRSSTQSEGKRRLSMEEMEANVKKRESYGSGFSKPGAFAVQMNSELDEESHFDPSGKRRVSMDRLENEAKKAGSASRRVSMERLEAETRKNRQSNMKKSYNVESYDSNRFTSSKRLEAEAKKNSKFSSENRRSTRSAESIEEFIARKQLAFEETESVGNQPDNQNEQFTEGTSIGNQHSPLMEMQDAEVPSTLGNNNQKWKYECTKVTDSTGRIIMTGASLEKKNDPESHLKLEKDSKGGRKVKRRFFHLIAIIVLIAIGMGVGFGLSKKPGAESRDNEGFEETSARDQCKNSNRIKIISSETKELYWKLVGVIVSRNYIQNEEEIDSCSSRNIALHLVSSQKAFDLETQLQRYLLTVLYLEWGGDDWESNTGWLTDSSECTWYGITCVDGFVAQLKLPVNNLRGEIERELFLLDSLEKIDLYDNIKLVGSLPTELGLLSNLLELNMQLVDVGFNLPSEIGGLSMIKELSIVGSVTDPLPSEIGLLTNLEILQLNGNDLTILPTEVGNLSQLKTFDFQKNRLISLPSEIFELSRLTLLHINNNVITGKLPEIYTSLPDLKELDISQNYFDGTIPFQTFDIMPNIETFQVSQNLFSGSIPSQIAKLTKLKDFNAEYNLISGSLPTELGLCISLESIQLKGNKIEGTVPTELMNIPHLDILTLSRNNIRGEISNEQCTVVRILDIDCQVKCPCAESCTCSAGGDNDGLYVNEEGESR